MEPIAELNTAELRREAIRYARTLFPEYDGSDIGNVYGKSGNIRLEWGLEEWNFMKSIAGEDRESFRKRIEVGKRRLIREGYGEVGRVIIKSSGRGMLAAYQMTKIASREAEGLEWIEEE